MRKRTRRALLLVALLIGAGIVGAIGLSNARADPVRRIAVIALNDWPAGQPPVLVALASDIHLGNAATDDARVRRVVARIGDDRPDLVLLAGDYVAGYDPGKAARAATRVAAALASLRPPLGIIAVLGNHDNDSDPRAIAHALRSAGATVIENDAVRRGPLLVGVAGDTSSGHARLGGTLNALRRLERARPGARIYLSHSPDILRWLPEPDAVLFAGHTHCGQIVLPVIGPVRTVSTPFGNRLICGLIQDRARRIVVTAGIGASVVPIRFGAAPDYWLIIFGPRAVAAPPSAATPPRTQ